MAEINDAPTLPHSSFIPIPLSSPLKGAFSDVDVTACAMLLVTILILY